MITNLFNIPQQVLDSIVEDKYDGRGEDIFCSVTDLLNPPHQWNLLKKTPKHEQIIDAKDLLKAWIRTAIHKSLYETHRDNFKDEMALELRINEKFSGKTITGQFDYYQDGVIIDYKTTSTSNLQHYNKFGNTIPTKWEVQLNCYALLLKKSKGTPLTTELRVIVICTDWDEKKIFEDHYPQGPVIEYNIELNNYDKTERWIIERIELFNKALIGETKECEAKEVWINKHGVRTRCGNYCSVSHKCEGYQIHKSVLKKELRTHIDQTPKIID